MRREDGRVFHLESREVLALGCSFAVCHRDEGGDYTNRFGDLGSSAVVNTPYTGFLNRKFGGKSGNTLKS